MVPKRAQARRLAQQAAAVPRAGDAPAKLGEIGESDHVVRVGAAALNVPPGAQAGGARGDNRPMRQPVPRRSPARRHLNMHRDLGGRRARRPRQQQRLPEWPRNRHAAKPQHVEHGHEPGYKQPAGRRRKSLVQRFADALAAEAKQHRPREGENQVQARSRHHAPRRRGTRDRLVEEDQVLAECHDLHGPEPARRGNRRPEPGRARPPAAAGHLWIAASGLRHGT